MPHVIGIDNGSIGAPGEIPIPDPLVRSQLLGGAWTPLGAATLYLPPDLVPALSS